jgi:hypothetical protein
LLHFPLDVVSRSAGNLCILQALRIRDSTHDRANTFPARKQDGRAIGEFDWRWFPFASQDIGRPGCISNGNQLDCNGATDDFSLKLNADLVWSNQIPFRTNQANRTSRVNERFALNLECEVGGRDLGETEAGTLQDFDRGCRVVRGWGWRVGATSSEKEQQTADENEDD